MDEKKIPTWLNGMTVAVLAMNFAVFGVYAFFSPFSIFPDLNDAGAYPVRFFAIRHIAFSLPLLHGLLKQDRTVLGTMYHIFLVMAVLDVVTMPVYGYAFPFLGQFSPVVTAVMGTCVFVIPMFLAVRALRSE